MAHLAKKAFWPAKLPFQLMHVDTGHNFPETMEFRDKYVKELGAELIVASVQKAIDEGKVVEEKGARASRNSLQTVALLEGIEEGKYDAALGGGRRDEEKARAKERFFSHRDEFGQWDPKNQRPELWNIFNGRKNHGEHFRVFPLSNWTEMDVWQYIKAENIELPHLYFSHERDCFVRDGVIMGVCDFVELLPDEKIEKWSCVSVPLVMRLARVPAFQPQTTWMILSTRWQRHVRPSVARVRMTSVQKQPWKTVKNRDTFRKSRNQFIHSHFHTFSLSNFIIK